jgi:hypothetical protein
MHDENGHDHAAPHPRRPDVEDLPATEPQLLEAAVRELLIEKGVFRGADLHRMLEAIDSSAPAWWRGPGSTRSTGPGSWPTPRPRRGSWASSRVRRTWS